MKRGWKILLIILAVIFAVILLLPISAKIITEIWWYQSVGYLDSFLRLSGIKILSFLIPAVGIWLLARLWFLIMRQKRTGKFLRRMLLGISVVAGIWGVTNWQTLILNLSFQSTGYSDPYFGLDSYFYLFRLPLIQTLLILSGLFFLSLFIIDIVVMREKEKPCIREGKIYFDFSANLLLILNIINGLAILFTTVLETLVKQPEAKIGIGYSTVIGNFIGMGIFAAFVILQLILWLIQFSRGKKISSLIWNFVWLTSLFFLSTALYPYLLEKIHVEPNELLVQTDYIMRRIEATRSGYDIILEDYDLMSNEEEDVSETVYKTRIWDTEPYQKVIRQVQEVKTYFDFVDVDVDRYTLSNGTFQTMVSARELNAANLIANASTWDNLHLRYTHGYGITLSPANRVTTEGGPEFWVSDLENETEFPELELDYPQIYYGELTSNFVVVKTEAEEFEYTTDTNRVTTSYAFEDGVLVNNFWRRVMFSLRFKDKMFLLTRYLNNQSRVLYVREITERVEKIFPFLEYDEDPYIAVIDGKLYWFLDAYITSDRYPVAERFETDLGEINYIRNPVKVVLDAYRGGVKFYVTDENDPVIAAYSSVFPSLFEYEIPEAFESHFRYPDTLFSIQSEVLCQYHVDFPESFYNGEDVWQIPQQTYGSEEIPFEPYYLLTKMEEEHRFSLIEPFTPVGKENLSSWLIAFYDGGLRLTLKYLDKTTSSLGPVQVEALINQDETLSQLFSLWGQLGSEIFRGNIQFIPLGDSTIYLEPILLESENTSIPQMAMIVGVYDGKAYYGDNFTELLSKMGLSGEGDLSNNDLAYSTLVEAYQDYLDAESLRISGDINAYSETVDNIGRQLRQALRLMEEE